MNKSIQKRKEHYLRHPFGEECCEAELKILKGSYQTYYFEETPFNEDALETDCYLIIGRRGTGKTSLSQFFTFQKRIKNARCIDIDEPTEFANVLLDITKLAAEDSNIAIPRIVKVWDYVFWTLIFSKYQDYSPEIKAAVISQESKGSFFIKSVLSHIIKKYLPDDAEFLSSKLEEFLSSKVVEQAKEKVLEITQKEPVIVAMDSLEKYSVSNNEVMMSLAALIQSSSNFNIEYAREGIHIKTFVSAEVFPYLTESAITNPVKFVRDPVYMHWRPKDLMRLACWRFHSHLKHKNELSSKSLAIIDWKNYIEVLENAWQPYFGEFITNGTGIEERTFPYILRHTQMRPRQIVVLCNAIAKAAKKERHFPYFYKNRKSLISVVKESEVGLANGVINAYSEVYDGVNKILDALSGSPVRFKGNYLDKIASRTASEWPRGDYSPTKFKQIVAELGIVGVVRSYDERAKIIEADFEYTLKDRLVIQSDDDCVLHPMFYNKFRAKVDNSFVVYPFPDHPDFIDL